MIHPTIAQLTAGAEFLDQHDLDQLLAEGERWASTRVPPVFRNAIPTDTDVIAWVRDVFDTALLERRRGYPITRTGPSLLILGPTGTGKTYQAYGALRALSASGVVCHWEAIAAPDLFARLRPRNGNDTEAEYERYAQADVLLLDDIGAYKGSEWTEEILYRLVNHRHDYARPTLITSNTPPSEFAATFGDRISSRIAGMSKRVVMGGNDRRRAGK